MSLYIQLSIFVAAFAATAFMLFHLVRRQKETFLKEKSCRTEWARRLGLEAIDPVRMELSYVNLLNTDAGKKILTELSAIEILNRRTTAAYNVFAGTFANHHIKLFEVRRQESSGESTTYRFCGVVSTHLSRTVPTFEIRRTRWTDKLRAFFGRPDTQLGRSELDKAFHISTWDTVFLNRLLDADAETDLMGNQEDSWHCLGDRLVVLRHRRCLEADFDQMLASCTRLAQKAEVLS